MKSVTVVVTTKNRVEKLNNCVNSILKSTCARDFIEELIIVDDKSTDGTTSYHVDSNQIASTVIHNPTEQLMVGSRNIGGKLAKAKYILFIDDDNVVDPDMIRELVYAIESEDCIAVVGPAMYYLDSEKPYLTSQKINFYTGKTTGISNEHIKYQRSTGIPNVFMIRNSVFCEVNFFDEIIVQTMTEPDFSLKALALGYDSVICINAKTYHDSPNGNIFERITKNQFKIKAYYLTRNRFLLIARYGTFIQKIIFSMIFSWMLLLFYVAVAILSKDYVHLRLYLMGHFDGLKYIITGKLLSKSESISIVKHVLQK